MRTVAIACLLGAACDLDKNFAMGDHLLKSASPQWDDLTSARPRNVGFPRD
jgi:hypothetical protein